MNSNSSSNSKLATIAQCNNGRSRTSSASYLSPSPWMDADAMLSSAQVSGTSPFQFPGGSYEQVMNTPPAKHSDLPQPTYSVSFQTSCVK